MQPELALADAWYCPDGQVVQLDAPVPDWKRPAAHAAQADDPWEAANLPWAQPEQLLEAEPVEGREVPAAHNVQPNWPGRVW